MEEERFCFSPHFFADTYLLTQPEENLVILKDLLTTLRFMYYLIYESKWCYHPQYLTPQLVSEFLSSKLDFLWCIDTVCIIPVHRIVMCSSGDLLLFSQPRVLAVSPKIASYCYFSVNLMLFNCVFKCRTKGSCVPRVRALLALPPLVHLTSAHRL